LFALGERGGRALLRCCVEGIASKKITTGGNAADYQLEEMHIEDAEVQEISNH